MREVVSLLINPVVILYLLLLISLVFFALKRKRTGKILVTIAGLWFIITTTPFLPDFLIKSLESQYPKISDSALTEISDACDIIVLGGGHTDDKNLSANDQLSSQALARLAEGIRIQRMIHGSRLILSGDSGGSELPQAVVLYRTALALGIDSSTMAMQTKPFNTLQEAKEYIKNFGTKNSCIIVTSAYHMPRAIFLFRKAGMNPIPAPTNYYLKHGSQKNFWEWILYSGNIEMVQVSLHEYIGILWAHLGGN
jgi:uncharacterized SAM-binding protein YcdF (DUF218 family)